MTNKKSTKRALLLSALSLLLCVSMLVGSTFAWFTDSVTSGKNVIAAGNLDVELTHADKGTNGEFKPVDESVVLFDDVALWEPGAVAYEKLTVSNVGDLALKYNLAVNIANANGVKHTDGKVYTLADVLKVAVVDAEKLTSREAAIAAGNEAGWDKLVGWSENGKLYPEEGKNTDAYGIVIYWEPSDNDNIWNLNNGKVTTDGKKVLTIELGVHLVATQLVHENDSFGPEYDKDAAWTGGTETSWYDPAKTEFTLVTAEELAGLAQIVNSGTDTFSGKTVKLGANIDLNNIAWTPIGTASAADEKAFTRTFNGTFIGTGYTISNLYVAGSNALGLFGRAGSAAHIEGVTIDGAYVSGNDYVGAVVGYGYLAANCLKNCTVTDATIIATPYLRADGQYDGGTKAGVIAGYALNGNVIGNTAKDSSVMAYRDLGGIAGMLNADGIGNRTLEASGNTVTNVTLGYVNIVGAYYEGKVNGNMNDFVGRIGSKSEVKDNNGEATKIETLGFAVSNDAELAIVLAQINGSENYWNREVTITMNANTYSADHVINQYPEWNGVVGAGSSANNMPSLNGTENHTNITFLGEEGVVFTGNVTVKGFGNAGSGFAKTTAKTTFRNVSFDAANSVEANGKDYIALYVKAAADDVNFVGCTFKNATHITLGGNGSDACGEVNFDKCAFIDGNCLSGYVETLNITDCDVQNAYKGFINKSKAGKVTVTGCTIGDSGEYVLRTATKGSGVHATITNTTIGTVTDLVYFRGSNESADFVNCTIAAGYTTAGTDADSVLKLDGHVAVETLGDVQTQLAAGNSVILSGNFQDSGAVSNGYGKSAIVIEQGQTFDGNGHTYGAKNASGTWDSAITLTDGKITNLTVNNGFRGIFIKNNTVRVVLENVIVDGTTYTISCDQGAGGGLEATNCTFNGWTSFAGTIGEVKFTDCEFGAGNGYNFSRPYAPTSYVGCDFAEGHVMDPRAAVTFENCTIGGEPLIAENLSTLVTSNIANATVIE